MAQKEKYDGQRLLKTEEEIRAHFRHWDFFEKEVQQFAIDRGLVNYMIIKPGTGRNLGLCTHCGKWVELEEGYSREERSGSRTVKSSARNAEPLCTCWSQGAPGSTPASSTGGEGLS